MVENFPANSNRWGSVSPRFSLRNRYQRTPGIVVVLLVIFASPLQAQVSTADIVGTVTDSSGAVLPGATVTATNLATGLT
jgi:hypothetical protein